MLTSQTPAPIRKRIGAYLIDSVLISVPINAAVSIVDDVPLVMFSLLALIISYFIGAWAYNDGQTLGKLMMEIKVVKNNGTSLTLIDAVLRFLLWVPGLLLFFVPWLIIFLTKNNRAIHDYVAQTIVISAPKNE